MKYKLPHVTLLGIDCVNVERLQAALDISQKEIEFGAVKLLTSLPTEDKRVVKIRKIDSVEDYSSFCINELKDFVDTEYVLVVQYDGFILNPMSWTDDFLRFDYIGAPWIVADRSVRNFTFPKELLGSTVVGNGGFSLRSRKFLEVSARLAGEGRIAKIHPEDVSLCVWNRNLMEEGGIKFAPPELAARFSVEGEEWTYKEQFGFHGLSWTNIDKWISEHPECTVIVEGYRRARRERLCRRLVRERSGILETAVKIFKPKAIEAHTFGSVGRGDADELSDLDIWFTSGDDRISQVLSDRLEDYSSIGEVIHICEPPQNAPKNGVHSFVLYKTASGLQQVDYYLCPLSSSFIVEGSKKLFGEIELPISKFSLNSQKVKVNESYHIDFMILFVFIAIKKLARKEIGALDDLFREYGYLGSKYNINVESIENMEDTFNIWRAVVTNLGKVSTQSQKHVLSEIEQFAKQVESIILNTQNK